MNAIHNVKDLNAEIQRLREESARQKNEMNRDLSELKEDLKPQNLFSTAVFSLTGIDMGKSNFFKAGFGALLNMLVDRYFIKAEKKFEGILYAAMDTMVNRMREFITTHTDPEAGKQERENDRYTTNK